MKNKFNKFKRITLKRIKAKKNYNLIIHGKSQKLVWSSFAMWLNKTTNKLFKYQKTQRAYHFKT